MRAHWENFYTEDYIKDMANKGIKLVRLPIGDWTINQYDHYVGCMDGAEEKIQWVLDTCAKNNIQVLIDIHTARGGQNGFDNGGQALDMIWTDNTHFTHWENQAAYWVGPYNRMT